MEIEQELSLPTVFDAPKLVTSSDAFPLPEQHIQYRTLNKADPKLREIFPRLYRWLDQLSGQRSYTLIEDSSSLKPFFDIFDYLRSNGIVERFTFQRVQYHDAPSFYRCDVFADYPAGTTDGIVRNRAIGHGFGKNILIVLSKAIGEFLERYFLTLYHHNQLLRSPYTSLYQRGIKALDPTTLPGFTREQKDRYPTRNFNKESIFRWETARRVSTGEKILVPAQLVYFSYAFSPTEPEPVLVETNTNGAGGYFTTNGAILSGIYELIQRDAFLIYWLNTLTPPRIDPESIPDDNFLVLLKEAKRYGFEVQCLNTTLDTNVPSFAVVIIDRTGRGPYFSLGAGCGADPTKALTRAFEEAWSVYYWIRPHKIYLLPGRYEAFFDYSVGQDERLRLAANIEMAQRYQFFISGEIQKFQNLTFDYPRTFSSEHEELSFLVKRIESLGPDYQVLYFPPKHPILDRLGYSSCQVIIPPLTPLYLRETLAPLAAGRLQEVPKRLGFKQNTRLNTFPHPFP